MDNIEKIEEIKNKLKTIFDPEIPVDIYELGLIYDVRLKDKNCEIDMTLTSPNCPTHSAPAKSGASISSVAKALGFIARVGIRSLAKPDSFL